MLEVRCSTFKVLPTSPLRVGRSGEDGVCRRVVVSPGWVVGICGLECESARPDPIFPHLALALRTMLPSPCQYKVGTREYGFWSSMAGLRLHPPMLHPEHYCSLRRVRGQSDWLIFLCKTLSFSVSSRFITALP